MNTDWLLKHIEQISEAPDAVPRLRRFILELAVRGKLVEQDPKDEPASELLSHIQLEKQQILACGRTQNQDLSSIEERETPFVIPTSWTWVRLGEVIKLWNGFAFKSSDYNQQGVPVIRIGDLQNGRVVLDSVVFVDENVAASVDESVWVPENALLIAMSGATTGKVAFNRTGKRLLLNQRVGRVQVFSVQHDFLRFFFETIVQQNLSISFGTAIPNLSTKQIYETAFPLPPQAEQHRIVAKVDELMALCDELEAAQAKRERRRDRLVAATLHGLNNGDDNSEPGVHPTFEESARFYFNQFPYLTTHPKHIRQLRQTILNLAVRGKLVPQDPEDEPAPKLLHRIEAEKTRLMEDGTIRKEKPLPPVSEVELPFLLPVNWRWVRIGTLSLMTDYGTSTKSDHYEDGVPVLKMGDIQDGRVHLGEQKKVPRASEDLPQLFLKHFDLLYNRTNSAELVGKTGIYMGEDDAYTFASYLIRIRFIRHLTSAVYANMAMNAPYFRETQIMPELKQQCGQANVNGTKLKSMIIPLPPLAEQYRIVAKVDELMALCDQMEARLTTTVTARRQLLEATLSEAIES